jgi:hypothetical protein
MTNEDAALIDRLGGPSKLAKRLRYDPKKGGVQRVQNWKIRGIPASVERDNQWIAKERRALRREPASEMVEA